MCPAAELVAADEKKKTLIKIVVIKVLTTWNPVLITLSLCLPTISFGGLTAWLNAGILYLFERPSAYGLIILAREIMSAKREPDGETVAFRNQHFVWLSVLSWQRYWLGRATPPLGFVCIPAHTCTEVVDTHRRKRLHFVPVCYSAYLKPLKCRYCSRGSSPAHRIAVEERLNASQQDESARRRRVNTFWNHRLGHGCLGACVTLWCDRMQPTFWRHYN